MRKLMWFTLGFALACGLGAYLYTAWLVLPAALCLTAFVLGLLFRKYLGIFKPVVAVLLGLSLGFGWFLGYRSLYLDALHSADGTTQTLTAEITDYSTQTDYGSTADARIVLAGKSYRVLLYLKENRSLKPGDVLQGSFRLRLTHEGLEGDTYHRGNGVFLLAYEQESSLLTATGEVPLEYFPALIRHQITQRLEAVFPEDVVFFAKALLLGDRSDVDYQTNTAFKVSGISHIIAVSGLHVSILFSLVFLVTARKRALTALFGIPILLLFAAMTGFTPSITRACVMQILIILADLINREYDPPTALSGAVLLMVLYNPVVITSASFQLSVGCMIGIFLFSEKLQKWITDRRFWKGWKGKSFKVRFRQWLASGIAVTFSAMFFTTPLVAYYFGCVSLIGVVTNLLTLWAVSWVFYGIVAVCILSLFWHQAAVVLAWLVSWPIRYVLSAARLLASIPLAAVYTKSIWILLWLVLCYLLAVRLFIKPRPGIAVVASGVVAGLCVALLLSWCQPVLDDCRMTVLDVGQGQSIILQAQGRTFLVDCGGSRDQQATDEAVETLLCMGIYRLDGVILTHYDGDHAGGMENLLARISADAVWLPRQSDDPELQQQMLQASGHCGVMVTDDQRLTWGTASLDIYSPQEGHSDNERSLCVLLRTENCAILITGDLGITGENRLVLEKKIPELTALVAGHHGSAYSTGDGLLAATRPKHVYISVGEDNAYGHPSQAVLDRLEQYGCEVHRTDLDGTLVFRR